MTRGTILITDCDLPGTALEDAVVEAGYSVVRPREVSAEAVVEAGQSADALIVQWMPITDQILSSLPQLRLISRLGIGYDMIDVDAATARGIAVTNTPEYCVEEVSAHTVAMLMTLCRGLPNYDRAVRSGDWAPTQARPGAGRPSALTVGVLGFGRIGATVTRQCSALGFRVLVADPYVSAGDVEAASATLVSQDHMLEQADFVTLHAPLVDATRHVINAQTIAGMKRGAVLINTCRGPLIDEAALVDALRSGHIAGAGIDVFEDEPLSADSVLRQLDEVLLSPHAAWYSTESLLDLPVHAAKNATDYLDGRHVGSIVNRVDPLHAGAQKN